MLFLLLYFLIVCFALGSSGNDIYRWKMSGLFNIHQRSWHKVCSLLERLVFKHYRKRGAVSYFSSLNWMIQGFKSRLTSGNKIWGGLICLAGFPSFSKYYNAYAIYLFLLTPHLMLSSFSSVVPLLIQQILQLDLSYSWAFGVKWSPSGNTLAYVGQNILKTVHCTLLKL